MTSAERNFIHSTVATKCGTLGLKISTCFHEVFWEMGSREDVSIDRVPTGLWRHEDDHCGQHQEAPEILMIIMTIWWWFSWWWLWRRWWWAGCFGNFNFSTVLHASLVHIAYIIGPTLMEPCMTKIFNVNTNRLPTSNAEQSSQSKKHNVFCIVQLVSETIRSIENGRCGLYGGIQLLSWLPTSELRTRSRPN